MYEIIGNRVTTLATFLREGDARAYVGDLASRGDWRGLTDISIRREGVTSYVAERGLTHQT